MPPTLPPTNAPQLHRFLGIGVTVIAVMFAFIMAVGVGPLLREPDGANDLIGYVMAGLALIEAAVALLVMKRRTPERRPGESTQQFWATRDTLNRIMTIWFMLTGAAILAAIAFLLTGLPVAAIVSLFAIAMFWMNGPNAFGQ